jgi:hypothetical protein
MRALAIGTVVLVWGFASGCANDPTYIPGPTNLEGGVMMDDMGALVPAKASLTLPIKTETAADMAARATKATALMVDVPYVKVGDIAVSVEWTIKNLDPDPGTARIQLNGANEYFSFDPELVVLDPGDDEAPKTPALQGDIPLNVPGNGELSGLFTEDNVLEASIDLDQITRGNVNPFRATLEIDKNAKLFQPMTAPMPADPEYVQTPTGPAVPREAFAQMIRIDLVFKPDHHMVLDYTVRVRDTRGIMDDMLLSAPAAELQTFMPMAYAPGM